MVSVRERTMPRAWKRVLIGAGCAVGLLVVLAWAVSMLTGDPRYKRQMEAAASGAIGMEVRIDGRLRTGFFPTVHLSADHCRVLNQAGVVVASARRASVWIELLPLLRHERRLRRIELAEPAIAIERDTEGRLDARWLEQAAAVLGSLDGATLSLAGGTLRYVDRRSGEGFEATAIDLTVSQLRDRASRGLNDVSLEAQLSCGALRTRHFALSALKVRIEGKDGIFHFEPVTVRIFGEQASGALQADLTGAIPRFRAQCSLPRFRIEEFLKQWSPRRSAEGTMAFAANLSMQGATRAQLIQTAAGDVDLRGEHLTLFGNDLDGAISRVNSSQHFSLFDVGAVLLAGPLGVAVTKGYGFASLFQGSGGTSSIPRFVSHWRVVPGFAQAQDVAMTTARNRIALQGRLDLVHERYVEVTVAVVDAGGCATVRQRIRGAFSKPVVEKPRVLSSLAGPVLHLLGRARGLIPSGPCDAFYTGSVAPPR